VPGPASLDQKSITAQAARHLDRPQIGHGAVVSSTRQRAGSAKNKVQLNTKRASSCGGRIAPGRDARRCERSRLVADWRSSGTGSETVAAFSFHLRSRYRAAGASTRFDAPTSAISPGVRLNRRWPTQGLGRSGLASPTGSVPPVQ
jgi:hypothetical protein